MDQGAKNWIYATARANYWRVHGFYELDDLIQDGFLKFAYVRERYPNVKTNRQVMALFKRAFVNHIHDLSRKRRRQRNHVAYECELTLDLASLSGGVTPNTSSAIALALRSPAIRKLLTALRNDPRAAAPLARYPDRTRQTTNDFFCRLIGADPAQINLHRELALSLKID